MEVVSRHCLKRRMNTMKEARSDNQCTGRDSKLSPPESKSEVSPLAPACSVRWWDDLRPQIRLKVLISYLTGRAIYPTWPLRYMSRWRNHIALEAVSDANSVPDLPFLRGNVFFSYLITYLTVFSFGGGGYSFLCLVINSAKPTSQ